MGESLSESSVLIVGSGPALGTETSAAERPIERESDRPARRERYGYRRCPQPMHFKGQDFPSRCALARHLELLTGRNASAIEMMLIELGDDAEATLTYYAAKPRPKAPVGGLGLMPYWARSSPRLPAA